MDVFSEVARAARPHLREAALHAGHVLGLFAALAEPRSAAEVARTLGLSAHRTQALLEVLALEAALERVAPAAFRCRAVPPRPAAPVPAGWGQLAEVLRRDRPLEEPGVLGTAGEALERFHRHLCSAGAGAAHELIDGLGAAAGGALLDLGAGAGAYSLAWLRADPSARAVLVDRAAVLALARRALAEEGLERRAKLVEADLESIEATTLSGYIVNGAAPSAGPAPTALLANLLHLFGPEACGRLVRLAAAAVGPGGLVVLKDLLLEPDHSGPAAGVLFSLNMALFTEQGRVHDRAALVDLLASAGLEELRVRGLRGAPDAVVVTGRVPRGPR